MHEKGAVFIWCMSLESFPALEERLGISTARPAKAPTPLPLPGWRKSPLARADGTWKVLLCSACSPATRWPCPSVAAGCGYGGAYKAVSGSALGRDGSLAQSQASGTTDCTWITPRPLTSTSTAPSPISSAVLHGGAQTDT